MAHRYSSPDSSEARGNAPAGIARFHLLNAGPLGAALIYAVIGAVWIIVSDRAVEWVFAGGAAWPVAQTVKGLLYVGATTVLVYWLARRALHEARGKWAEEQLRLTRNLLDRTLASLGEAVFVIDPTRHIIVQCNPAAERLFGFKAAEMVGRGTEILHVDRESHEGFGALSEAALARHEVFRTQFRMKRKDDGIIETEHTVTAIDEDVGWKGGVVSIVCDISAHKQAERSLQESKDRYRALVGTIPDLVWLKDMNGVYLSCNPTFERFFGAREADIVGRTDHDFVDKDLADFFRDHDRKAVEAGGPSVNEEWLTFADNGYRGLFETIKTPMLDARGQLLGVLGISRDITERQRAEDRLRKAQDLLKETGDLARVGGWEIETDSSHVYWTQTLKAMLEAPDDYAPTLDDFIGFFAPEVRTTVKEALRRVRGEGSPFDMEAPFITAGGRKLWVHIIGKPELRDGRCVRVHGTIQDITEKVSLELQLRQAQKMDAVGRLAGGVAHDFNNMLGVILGNAQLAMEELDPSHPAHAGLEEIRKAAERSSDLTRQLLAFARRQTVAPRVLDLNKTVEPMLKMLRRLLGEDIDLAWLPGQNLWPVKVDPSQIDQILVNLCVNARDAMAGTGRVTIRSGNTVLDEACCQGHVGSAPGEYVRLTVSDNGRGMDEGTRSKVFEPFFTTKGVGEGTGLGLATVYGIVKQNNGCIDVYSEPGRGAAFVIHIPRHGGKADEDHEGRAVESPPSRGETVLLLEDEPRLLDMIRRMLERKGYTVLAANSPGEALRVAGEHPGEIQLLLTDVVMPGMNGRELAKTLHTLYPSLKFLFMSGYTADIIAHHGVLENRVQFIQKPFSHHELAVKVREALDE